MRAGLLIAAALAAIFMTLYALLAETSRSSAGASEYSTSAIGHAGLLELLRQRGVEASASEGATRLKLAGRGLLVLAEPDFDLSGQKLRGLLFAPRVLLVLPKWAGDADRRGWITLAGLKPAAVAQSVLDLAIRDEIAVVRPAAPFAARTNLLGAAPHLEDPPQLIEDDAAEPLLRKLLADGDRMLLSHASLKRGELWVLSDPDVISNHGLATGNAALAVAIIDRARAGGPVVFDETIHGFESVPNGKLRLLAARPFAGATLAAILAVAMLVWATWQRFGADVAEPDGIAAGRMALIANIADLLVFAGHLGDVLRRYVQVNVEDVAARLHAPDTGDTQARAAWLAQAEMRRQVRVGEAQLRAEAEVSAADADPARAFALARRAYAWRKEMLRGT